MLTQLPRVPSLIPSSFATRAIGREVSITIFTASSLNSGEKLFFGRGNYFTFPDVHPNGWTVRKLRGTPHCGGVAQDVRGELLGGQGRAGLRGGRLVLGEPGLEGVAGHRLAMAGGEQYVGGLAGAFGEPVAQHPHGRFVQRRAAFLPALIPTLG